MSDERAAHYLALRGVKGVSDRLLAGLVSTFGDIAGVLGASKHDLVDAGLTEKIAEVIRGRGFDLAAAKKELKLAKSKGITPITLEDSAYPAHLKDINDPPALMYMYGDASALERPMIAVIGARKASAGGEAITRTLARDLAEVGFTVVSGYAMGIDIHAHRGAVETGKTAAVLGSGMLRLYPEENRRYLKDIVKNGCVISEFPLEEPPNAYNFPRRNRIISGLSLGVLVVEASAKSGSLITVKTAVDQGREVFAVPAFPGNINRATNDLIKNGARLVESYMDVVEEFSHLFTPEKHVDKCDHPNIMNSNSPGHTIVIKHLSRQPMGVDELCAALGPSGFSTQDVMGILSEMELDGVIVREKDGKFRTNGALDGQDRHGAQSHHRLR